MGAPLYLLALLLPSVLGQCTVKTATPKFSRSVYEFSVDLIQRLGHDTENHFIASPLSLWTLISTIAVGADGVTLTEINKTLRRNPVECFNKKYLEIVRQLTSTTDTSTTLERASAVFVDKDMPVHEDYQRKLTATGVCEIQILPFENFQTVATTINDYVSRITHSTIQDIVTPNDIEGVFVILIDAIYFKGQWSYPFEPARTEITKFYDEYGKHVGYVNMMQNMVTVRAGRLDQIKAKVLELPYGIEDRFSMLVLLPFENVSVATVMSLLKRVAIRSVFISLNQYPEEVADVQIPRFKISSDLDNLKELLIDMGLKTMFDGAEARFPYISEYELYVSNILQKAQIEVNEEGSEASAASAAEMQSRTLPDSFVINKPFLFMIVDKELNLPLFTGAYSKPSTY